MGGLDDYNVTDDPVRSWDEYFFNVCRQVARNSKCLSRRIGAVLVYDKSINILLLETLGRGSSALIS